MALESGKTPHSRKLANLGAAFKTAAPGERVSAPFVSDSVVPVHPAVCGYFRLTPMPEVVLVSPAAGADMEFTVPNGEIWELMSLWGKLVTSAAVANRLVACELEDPLAQTVSTSFDVSVQGASLTYRHNFQPFGSLGAHSVVSRTHNFWGTVYLGTMPPARFISAGWKLRTRTGLIQAGDQWSECRLMIYRYVVADNCGDF